LKTLIEIQESTGITPKALENRPFLEPSLYIYVTSFYDLSASRSYAGMGSALPIAISEILAYCNFYGFDDPEFRQSFYKYIRAMDNAQLATINKESDTDAKTA
jgi:hypothetical protein